MTKQYESETKHTAEPWKCGSTMGGVAIWKGKEVGEPVYLIALASDKIPLNVAMANARRIVECVNALEGIESPQKFVQAARALADRQFIREAEKKAKPC